jgi:hypothetical protein
VPSSESTRGVCSSSVPGAVTDLAFSELQAKLRTFWPSVTLRSIGEIERTVVVVHSLSFDVPDHLIPVFPAYEERFLCLVLRAYPG